MKRARVSGAHYFHGAAACSHLRPPAARGGVRAQLQFRGVGVTGADIFLLQVLELRVHGAESLLARHRPCAARPWQVRDWRCRGSAQDSDDSHLRACACVAWQRDRYIVLFKT